MKKTISAIQFLLMSIVFVKAAYGEQRVYRPKAYKSAAVTSRPVVYPPTAVAATSIPVRQKPINLNLMAGATLHQNETISVAFGASLEFMFSENFGFSPEVLYLQKFPDDNSQLHMLEVPLLAKLKLGSEAAKIELFAGPAIGFCIVNDSATANGGIDSSAHAGVGVRFGLPNNTGLFLNGRFMQSLSKMEQNGFLFMSGLSFGL